MELVLFVGMSTAVFAAVVLGLVAILTVAKQQLVPQGLVKLVVNDDNVMEVSPGQTLLSALSAQKIFLPSACGGGGTCAMCKCQVLDGGGDILPTEVGLLTRSERKDNWRLGCQVKVKQDMLVKVPEEIFGIQKFTAVVRSNENVATFIKEFVIELKGAEMDFEPGGYIQIDIPKYRLSFKEFEVEKEYRDDWDTFKLWDLNCTNDEEEVYRAYSMANHPAEGNIVMLNVRIATPPRGLDVPPGIASSYIFNLKPGDPVVVSGPYGDFHINRTQREMIYIGGGAGMAPLRSHLFHIFHTEKDRSRKVSYWYGARSMREMFYMEQFEEIEKEFENFEFNLALSNPMPEDNWEGYQGFIHQVLLDEYLSKHEAPEDCEYYICGPPMMLQAVERMLDMLGVPDENIRYDDFGG
ncbi:MAG: Na+-transporting NADH:ubiquinone oxidoreductase subunit F [Myxococcota bacterium]|jgi:Na+-transporting NADH:ubiquinone oxidoreductase subunit F